MGESDPRKELVRIGGSGDQLVCRGELYVTFGKVGTVYEDGEGGYEYHL